jgi:hypothetical protein
LAIAKTSGSRENPTPSPKFFTARHRPQADAEESLKRMPDTPAPPRLRLVRMLSILGLGELRHRTTLWRLTLFVGFMPTSCATRARIVVMTEGKPDVSVELVEKYGNFGESTALPHLAAAP